MIIEIKVKIDYNKIILKVRNKSKVDKNKLEIYYTNM